MSLSFFQSFFKTQFRRNLSFKNIIRLKRLYTPTAQIIPFLITVMKFTFYPPKTKQISDGMPLIPSVPKLQQMIESAWSKGFDPDSCHQLQGRLVNTQKWIGATDIVATLASLGVRYVQIMSKLSLIE